MLKEQIYNRLAITSLLFVLFCFLSSVTIFAQSIRSYPLQPSTEASTHQFAIVPIPRMKPNPNMPVRRADRVGTSIVGARNSISIKSTDAGIIHRPPLPGTCSNCGVIDFINILGQGHGMNAIAAGVVAGTIAREIGRYDGHHHAVNPGGRGSSIHHQGYNVGITMQDGSQAIITLPDASHFNRGDQVQLIDGVLVPHH